MRKATLVSVLGVCLVVGQLAAAGPAVADPGLVVQDLTTSLTANDLAQTIVGSGSASRTSPSRVQTWPRASSPEEARARARSSVPIGRRPQHRRAEGRRPERAHHRPERPAATATWTGSSRRDSRPGCVVLTFDFTPDASEISSNTSSLGRVQRVRRAGFNDVFGFFVNGQNCAMVDSSPCRSTRSIRTPTQPVPQQRHRQWRGSIPRWTDSPRCSSAPRK